MEKHISPEIIVEQANRSHILLIKDILKELELPFTDIDNFIDNFLIAKADNEIVGNIGIEVYNSLAVLRSLGVKKKYQGLGIGHQLFISLKKSAYRLNISEIYLLTETAENFFAKYGFIRHHRNKVPQIIKQTNEFKTLCPATAVCMILRM